MCPHTKTQNSPRRVVPAALLKAGTLVAVAFLIAGVLGGNQVAWAQGQPIVLSAVGDVPYSDSEKSEFQEHMDSHDLYSASEFLVHLGDIKSGGSSCAESWYRDMATSLKTLSVPAFIIPGDNEWNDCSNPSQAWAFWTTHLLAIERTFCGLPLVERQAVRPENFAFVKNGVLFIGINKVSGGLGGGETSTRLQQNADWVTGQLQTKGSSVRALVIFAQASPSGSPFESAFRAAASAFAKPVLYIHGDGHSWTYNEGYLEPNITRVQVDRGSISHPPVHVTVTMDPANAFLFDRNPWPSGTSPLNRPPCVEAGPDTQRPAGTTVVQLNGKVSDDGEPIPSNVTVNWTYVSGPGGVVTFGNPHAASTTAQFGFDGSYTLQLTATDGALTTSDTVVVDIGVVPNGPPSVTITTPANESAFDESQTVTFTGSAADDSDGDLTASLSWTSSLDGVIGSGATISTSALSLGVHTITASVTDSGGRTGSQALTITITSVGTPTIPPPSPTVEVRVASGTDDAEESATGSVSLTSSDLELVVDGSNQTVGMRFNGVAVEKGATINNAWIQFQADQTSSVATSVMIRGQAADNATTFTTSAANLSSRPKTTAAVSWSPVPWNTVGAAGADQRTPNLSSVIQEIVNRAGWSSGNSLAILITGTGQRVAESFNGVPGAAPLLHIESVSGVPSPDIDVVPNPYGFGSVDIGGTASGTIAIKNVGSADLRVNSISLVDNQAGAFAITQGGAAPFVLAPSATHD
ncbi:MAG: PKD domain-containing protein, partial [Vicinamibacterales bacterium]